MIENPFDIIERRFNCLENLLLEIKKNGEQNKQNSVEEELLTSEQTAKIFKISKVTLHAWKLDGKVKSYRIGSRIRFKRSEVLEALNELKTIKGRR